MFSNFNMRFFSFLIKIILLIELLSKRVSCVINLNSSYIIFKIKGTGNRNIFHPDGSFHDENHPDIVKVNNQSLTQFNSIHNFNQEINTVILEWINDRNDYSHLFHGCPDIIEIDLTNFKTSQVKLMGSMFRECSSLTSINFANFDSTNAEDMGAMFFGCKKLISIDLSRFDTSHVTFMWNMFAECSSLISLDLSKFNTSKVDYMWGMFSDCKSLISLNLSNFNTSLVTQMGEFFKNCISLEYINMLNFEENNLNYAGDMFQSVPNNLVVCLNMNNNINKILTELQTRQCYSIDCSDDWKSSQNKIIKDTGECITNCIDSDQYKYIYDNKCYNDCPIGSQNEGNFTCKCIYDKCLECPDEAYTKNLCTKCNYEYYQKENDTLNTGKYIECYKNPNGFYLDADYSIYRACYSTCETCEKGGTESNHNCLVCKENNICLPNDDNIQYNIIDIIREINNISKNEELNEYYDKVLEIIKTYFSIKIYNTSNIDKGEEDIILIDNIHVTLTKSENQKNNLNNDNYITNNTLIDLKECELSLRYFYNLSKYESLYILKIDVIQEGMKIPKVEYNIYSKLEGKNLQKLNLSICEKNKINIYTNIGSISNLDIINPISKYYTDICYPATSYFGTDITLNDRKNEFVEKNKTVCQEDCTFIGYNYTTKKANCSCNVKEPSLYYKNIIIDKNKLFRNFMDINYIANIDFLLCYKILFTKNGLLKNVGSYILILIILFHFIFIFIFYIKSYPKIINIINNFFKYKNNSNQKDARRNKFRKLNCKNIFIQKKNEKKIFNKEYLSVYKNLKNKRENYKDKKKIDKIEYVKKIKKPTKLSYIFKYTIDEINDLSYELAIKNDKRTYCDYYISLLKTKHDLLFSFYYNQDYNSKILKIDLFILEFAISYIINGLFFNDDTLHKIYMDKSSFDFMYQLPKTIYSTLISSFLDFIFKYLALSNDSILEFKKIEPSKDLEKGRNCLVIKLKIKFVVYFIISSILLILFWYYIAMFGVIYKNTQKHLIKDTICSYTETIVYPFLVNLLPGIFRIPALSNKKNKREYLYKISLIFQKL